MYICPNVTPTTQRIFPPLTAAAGGPGAGAGQGELSDPHGGGGGRDQRRQCHGRFGDQATGKPSPGGLCSVTQRLGGKTNTLWVDFF